MGELLGWRFEKHVLPLRSGREGGSGNAGDDFNFDESVFGKAGYGNRGSGRFDRAGRGEILRINLVHGGEVLHVFQKDNGFDDVAEAGAGGSEDGLEVFKRAGGLLGDAAGNKLTGRGIEGDLAGGIDEIAQANGLGVGSNGARSPGSGDRGLFAHLPIVPGDDGMWQAGLPPR